MSRLRVRSNALALLACSTFLIASFGCSNDPGVVTAPDSAPQNVVVDNPNFVRILSASSKGDTDPILRASAVSTVISAENGGTISNGRVTLEFPAGALDEDTQITIEMVGDGTLGVELGPHGTVFNKPVVMTVDLSGTTAEGRAYESTTLWMNPEMDRWERVEKVDSEDNNAGRSLLRHFSRYNQDVGG